MQRDTGLIFACATVGAVLWAFVVFLPTKPVAMPLGGPDPTLLEGEETTAPITPLTEIPRAMRQRLANASPDLLREFKCLALNVYWEAKGEPLVGQMAVAAVTLNRLGNPRFPKSVCEVVWQGVENGRANCQFSWACDRQGDRPLEDIPWQRAQQVAYRAMFLDPFDPTNGALYFHANYVRPLWADEKARIMRIGRHIFYGENPTLPSLINVANRS